MAASVRVASKLLNPKYPSKFYSPIPRATGVTDKQIRGPPLREWGALGLSAAPDSDGRRRRLCIGHRHETPFNGV